MWTLIWNDLALDELVVPYVAADPARQAQIAGAVEKLNTRLRTTRCPRASPESRATGSRSRPGWPSASG